MRLLLLTSMFILCFINIRKVNLCPPKAISYKESRLKMVPSYKNPYTAWRDYAKQDFVYTGNSINEELGFRENMTSAASTEDCYTFCKMEKKCKFWNYWKYETPESWMGGCGASMYGGCDNYTPKVTYKQCQIFNDDVSSRVRFDHPSHRGSIIYINFQVFSGHVKSLDKATITDKWQKLVTCDARGPGPAFKKCGYDRTYGMSKMISSSSGTSNSFTMEFGLEYGWTDALKTTLKQSSTIGYNWDSTSSQTFQTAQTTST